MQGHIVQLEDSRAHRYYHHIDMKRHFLSWKITSQEISRTKIDLLTSIDEGEVSYSKEDMTRFLDNCWGLHIYPDGTITDETLCSIKSTA